MTGRASAAGGRGLPSEAADVIVVGAGPAGSSAALRLAQAGLDVLVLEKARFPREKVCGDGLTPRAAEAVAHLSNGQSLRFPVQGTSKRNAVMTATDDSGEPVFRLRQVRNTGRGEERQKVVEVVVAPGRQITPDLPLVMATGYHNLANFFDRPGGGP